MFLSLKTALCILDKICREIKFNWSTEERNIIFISKWRKRIRNFIMIRIRKRMSRIIQIWGVTLWGKTIWVRCKVLGWAIKVKMQVIMSAHNWCLIMLRHKWVMPQCWFMSHHFNYKHNLSKVRKHIFIIIKHRERIEITNK